MTDKDKIQEGDLVDFYFADGENGNMTNCLVLYVPQATGDCWHVRHEGGSLHYIQHFEQIILKSKGEAEMTDKDRAIKPECECNPCEGTAFCPLHGEPRYRRPLAADKDEAFRYAARGMTFSGEEGVQAQHWHSRGWDAHAELVKPLIEAAGALDEEWCRIYGGELPVSIRDLVLRVFAALDALAGKAAATHKPEWRVCSKHKDVNPETMWGCPDCLAELRQEVAQVKPLVEVIAFIEKAPRDWLLSFEGGGVFELEHFPEGYMGDMEIGTGDWSRNGTMEEILDALTDREGESEPR